MKRFSTRNCVRLSCILLLFVCIHLFLSYGTYSPITYKKTSPSSTSSQLRNSEPDYPRGSETNYETCREILDGTASDFSIKKFIRKPNHSYNLASKRKEWTSSERFTDRYYYTKPITNFEENFPIAFSFVLYSDFDQFEQLFMAVFRPQNYYCIHLTAAANSHFKSQVSYAYFSFPSLILLYKPLISNPWGLHNPMDSIYGVCIIPYIELQSKISATVYSSRIYRYLR